MANRHAVSEVDNYQQEEERPGMWGWVKSWFGPDDSEAEREPHDADSSIPSRRHQHTSSFLPLGGAHRGLRVSVRLNATTMEDAQEAADSLKDRSQVILNLEHADEGMDRRILDFVSGACYALDGGYQRVGSKVFLFAPSNIYIEVEDEAINGSVRPPTFMAQQA
ncbi:MAG TPA: cell division protein SepF [Armatimonadota bacterium]|nr:cell division protein SepF [Armatimonadota bacterium]